MYKPLLRWHRREKKVNKNGYVVVYVPEHPRNFKGYVYEHRLVVESIVGRVLETWEEVHHINRIRHDNGRENLFLCSRQQHCKAHQHMLGLPVLD